MVFLPIIFISRRSLHVSKDKEEKYLLNLIFSFFYACQTSIGLFFRCESDQKGCIRFANEHTSVTDQILKRSGRQKKSKMSLGVKLDTLRGPGAPGERLARVIFRGKIFSIIIYKQYISVQVSVFLGDLFIHYKLVLIFT